MRTLRTLPAMFRLGVAQALAYRAELVIWMLTSTMPLIMLPLWHAVAEQAPIAGFSQSRFTAYFLAGFVIRQMVGNWASWTINNEVRTGALNRRLLRPIHPLIAYATESLSTIPIRSMVALPVGLLALAITEADHLATEPLLVLMAPLSVLGAWAIGFFAHVAIGSLSLWMHQSIKVVDVWSAGFFIFSGYLVPVALFPSWLRGAPDRLPFQYQHGFPIDLITGALDVPQAAQMLGVQWLWVFVLAALAVTLWRRGLRRYGAYGG